jgi:hypothetical protein
MSDSTGQLSNQQLFDAAVRNFEKKLPARFRALMPYKEGIAGLRAKSASFRTIAQILKQTGVTVSHDTVARFCHAVIEQPQPRQKSRPKADSAVTEERRAQTQKPQPSDVGDKPGVSALLQQRRNADATPGASGKSRGPRIADPKNV